MSPARTPDGGADVPTPEGGADVPMPDGGADVPTPDGDAGVPTPEDGAGVPTPDARLVRWFGTELGARAELSESFGEATLDVGVGDWIEALTRLRDSGYAFFDWLTGVDDPPDGFHVVANLYDPLACRRLLVRTRVPRSDPRLPSAVDVYRGANWHERETYEMFGVTFDGHPNLVPLLLPDGFEGHPLRKDFILAARVAKQWPGAKEPGESGHGAPSRRKTLPPGVPADWGTTPDA